jgi:diguanylate cyclase (GGDEF)-like protein
VTDPQMAAKTAHVAPNEPAGAHAPAPGAAVVVVTLDDGLASELVGFLRANGFLVERAATPDQIAEAVGHSTHSSVLLDLDGIPKIRWTEDLRRIAAARPATVPWIGLVGHTDVRLHLEAIRCGMESLFVKPIDLVAVADLLDQRLRPVREDPFRIVVIDDSRATADVIQQTLEQASMACHIVNDPLQAIDAIRDFRPDLILTDMDMPSCSGPELAALIRMYPGFLGIPIVFLSSATAPGLQIEAMRRGADDFLARPVKPEALVASVRMRCQRARLLRSQMLRDGLTGLYNHTTLKDRLDSEVARAHRLGTPLCYAMLDLDHFKNVNDTHGHPVGDQVIISLARLLRRRLRKHDVIGRYGGEEFAVLLPDTRAVDAVIVLDALRVAFCAIPQPGLHGPFSTSFSCGIAELRPDETGDALNTAADHALYVAKSAGRNRVLFDQQRHPTTTTTTTTTTT